MSREFSWMYGVTWISQNYMYYAYNVFQWSILIMYWRHRHIFLSLDATYISVCTYNQEHSIQDAKTLQCDVTGQVLEPISINECSGIACALSSNAIVFNANLASNNCQIQNCTEQELASLPVTSSDPGFNIHVSSDVTPTSGSSCQNESWRNYVFFLI